MFEPIQSWSLFLGVLTVTFIALGLSIISARKNRKIRQTKGLQWLAGFRELLSHIQKHRGLTSGYLSGGKALKLDVELMQSEVSLDLKNITRIDDSIENNSRWCGVTQHWARLAGNYPTHSISHNLSQHNMLIKNVLYLIDDLAQECDLLLLKSRDQKPLHLYWRELLSAAEYIGQARAIGLGVSTAEHCDSISRIRLNYLSEKIEGNTQRLWNELGNDPKQAVCIEQLLECITQQLVLDRPSIAPNDFFELATAAIDSLLEQFDRLVKEQLWSQKLAI
ncbi:MAG: hypothetical protein ACRBBW_12635 [Cellvibrionaceae bacterium]